MIRDHLLGRGLGISRFGMRQVYQFFGSSVGEAIANERQDAEFRVGEYGRVRRPRRFENIPRLLPVRPFKGTDISLLFERLGYPIIMLRNGTALESQVLGAGDGHSRLFEVQEVRIEQQLVQFRSEHTGRTGEIDDHLRKYVDIKGSKATKLID